MELPVGLQLRELAWALGAGLVFGLVHDLLRPLRRGRWTGIWADGTYCLVLLAGLLAFALYAGRGRLRLFALGAMAGTGSLWMALVSPRLYRLERALETALGRGLRRCVRFRKNFSKNGKN